MLRSGQISRHPDTSVPRGDAAPRRSEAAAHDAQFDGLHGVWTSFATMPADAIRQRSAEIWTIEHGFRTLPTDLGIRPVFHGTEGLVLAHITFCCAAFVLLRMLIYPLRRTPAWAQPLFEAKVLAALQAVQSSLLRNNDTDRLYWLPSAPRRLQKAIYQLLNVRMPVYCAIR